MPGASARGVARRNSCGCSWRPKPRPGRTGRSLGAGWSTTTSETSLPPLLGVAALSTRPVEPVLQAVLVDHRPPRAEAILDESRPLDDPEVLTLCRLLASNGAADEAVHARHARFLVAAGNLSEARAVLEAVLKLSPGSPEALAVLAEIAAATDDDDLAGRVRAAAMRSGPARTAARLDPAGGPSVGVASPRRAGRQGRSKPNPYSPLGSPGCDGVRRSCAKCGDLEGIRVRRRPFRAQYRARLGEAAHWAVTGGGMPLQDKKQVSSL